MLKLTYVYNNEHNHGYFTFTDEFTKKTYGSRTFQSLNEAVEYARASLPNENIDLYSVCKPEYNCVESGIQYEIDRGDEGVLIPWRP
jgi:hypothetical protein